jgi:hypothetical protein
MAGAGVPCCTEFGLFFFSLCLLVSGEVIKALKRHHQALTVGNEETNEGDGFHTNVTSARTAAASA